MSVRTLLGALLTRFYSKKATDKSEIADLSGINTKSAVTLTNNSVSPKTGYAIAQMTSDVAGVTAGYLYVDGKPVCGNRVYFQSPDSYILLAPVSKGAQVLVDKVNATVKSITVYGLQGGGKEIVELLQLIGGAVCLSNRLKHFSTESHYRKLKRGSRRKFLRTIVGITTSRRLAMAMCIFSHTTARRSVSQTIVRALCTISDRLMFNRRIGQTASRLRRGIKSTFTSVEMQARLVTPSACSSRSKVSSAINQEVSYAC